MLLSLQGVVPAPLRERVDAYDSGIWKKEVSFAEGEHVFVKAPSGTGKTTLIHILYGVRTDYSGNVAWGGKDLRAFTKEQQAVFRAQSISVIFQDMRLFPNLTAWENLEAKRQLTETVQPARVAMWMEELGIGDKKNALCSTMSYGEQQRLAIIRALLQPFEWLLMDEPFSHLDNANTIKATRLISEMLKQNGAGLLLADLDENTYFPYTRTIQL